MVLRPANAPASPRVEVPGPDADRPSWGRVGVLAAIGFVVGVAWPKLAGVRVGPSVPESAGAAGSASTDPGPPASAAPAPVASGALAAAAPSAGSPPVDQPVAGGAAAGPADDSVQVTVARSYVATCRTPEGDTLKGSACGSLPGLDAVVAPRLRRLASCPAASGSAGALRLAVTVDFTRSTLAAEQGRGRSLDGAPALVACARAALASASIASLRHEYPRYVVGYTVTFASPPVAGSARDPGGAVPRPAVRGSPADTAPAMLAASSSGSPASPPASGSPLSPAPVQVEWDAAVVRDAPKTGRVVARLPRGSPLRVGSAQDGWYAVHYGDGFASEGWIYRGAIGR